MEDRRAALSRLDVVRVYHLHRFALFNGNDINIIYSKERNEKLDKWRSTMDNFLKTDEGFQTTLKLMDTINHSTDDYLFIWDIRRDT
jgi:hypothetical protein